MQVFAYLNFDGRCEEAFEFYKQAAGATDVQIMRFKDSPEPCDPNFVPPGAENKVMHGQCKIGETTVMASDCYCAGKPAFQGISLALSVKGVAEAGKVFDALADGGQVQMPMAKTFWSPSFGMCADKFGVAWMVMAEAE